jgi:hypothetical protein
MDKPGIGRCRCQPNWMFHRTASRRFPFPFAGARAGAFRGNPWVSVKIRVPPEKRERTRALRDACARLQTGGVRTVSTPLPCGSQRMSAHSGTPIAGAPPSMHHRHDPDLARLIHVKHGVGKTDAQGAAHRPEDPAESPGLPADPSDHRLHFIMEASGQIGVESRVVSGSCNILCRRSRVKCMRLHRPTIRRTRSETSSPGIPWTSPRSNSASRRQTSSLKLVSPLGSTSPRRPRSRSTSSAMRSSGQDRVSSTI